MNKKLLIEKLSEELKLKKKDVEEVIEGTFSKITEELVKGNTVRIVGFGQFEVRRRIAREGRNPQTGEKMILEATKRPAFLPGHDLKLSVKGKRDIESK
jgi:DNA-binding protein HU-beta